MLSQFVKQNSCVKKSPQQHDSLGNRSFVFSPTIESGRWRFDMCSLSGDFLPSPVIKNYNYGTD